MPGVPNASMQEPYALDVWKYGDDGGDPPMSPTETPTESGPPTLWSRSFVANFLLRRLASGVLTLLAASLLIFLATNALPGNIAAIVLGRSATSAQVHGLEHRLGLNRPLLVQYWHWLWSLLHGNMGQSAAALAQGSTNAPVSKLVGPALQNSLLLAGFAATLLLPLALVAGTWAAVQAGRAADYVISYTALILGSVPEFVLGTLLIVVFFGELNWFPPVTVVAPGGSPLDQPKDLGLPVLTLLGTAVAFNARQVRANVAESLREDYTVMARLNGIRERRVLWRYALRNSLASSVQSFAQTLQYLLGGIIVVEALFNYPGVGDLLVNAVQNRDVPLVQAIAFTLAAIYVGINILADLAVVMLVPKLRTSAT